MSKRYPLTALVALGLAAVLFSLRPFSTSLSAGADIDQIKTKAACEELKGQYVATHMSIPGDGNRHNFSVRAPNDTSELLGAYVSVKRDELDNDYRWECPLNVPDANDGNSLQRRCGGQAQDMSVESCTFIGGSNSNFSCEYVNAAGAKSKSLEIWSCWQ